MLSTGRLPPTVTVIREQWHAHFLEAVCGSLGDQGTRFRYGFEEK
jgi:hypothetical protein